ncbi:hypothetical protein QTP88_007725 [Uroleucon formosanum]
MGLITTIRIDISRPGLILVMTNLCSTGLPAYQSKSPVTECQRLATSKHNLPATGESQWALACQQMALPVKQIILFYWLDSFPPPLHHHNNS